MRFPAPIFLALLLNEVRNDKAKRFVQTVTYMPHFISIVVIVGMIKLFLSPQAGLYGGVVRAIGATPINLLAAQQWFRTIYVVSDVWQHMGWSSIIYLAALSAVDPNLYEAAPRRRRHQAAEDHPHRHPLAVADHHDSC